MSKTKLTKIYAENQITGNKKWFTDAVWKRLRSRTHNGKEYPRQGYVQVNRKPKSKGIPEAAKKVPKLTEQGLKSIRAKLLSGETKGLSNMNHLIPFALQTKAPIANASELPSHQLIELLTDIAKEEEAGKAKKESTKKEEPAKTSK